MQVGVPGRLRGLVLTSLLLACLILAGCGADSLSETPTVSSGAGQGTLVIGNIDASNPSEKIAEFQPLVDFLVAHLEEFGFTEGRIVIARDPSEMARMLGSGEVDIYIDAAIPSLQVCDMTECDFALRQWKGGGPELTGVFVKRKGSEITSLEDLRGQIIMLEQPHSTVGHILPLAHLAELGITTRRVNDLKAVVGEDEVGYYVASGGQTSMNLLLNGEIAAAAIGERAFKRFSPDVHAQVEVIDQTIAAPSQLVTFGSGFDADLAAEIRRLMISLEQSDEGQAILQSLRDTARFDELPAGLEADLNELWEAVQIVLQN